eukprot:TRINITY_DN7714_c0_g1_i1.p1 TRINITY_DN7714_c0_g1~~TRINITY_DN7714_c0_g1_i1.p1  ORF type:complete len:1003 (+),score=152.22 TRINITY_DN7714_c0_g1_i1:447-3011(+)
MSQRTMALAVGRSMLTMHTVQGIPTQRLTMAVLELNGIVPPNGATISLNTEELPESWCDWPSYHQGVALGARVVPEKETNDIRWWPWMHSIQAMHERAGYLFSMAVSGHLQRMTRFEMYRSLAKQNHLTTSVALLLGLSLHQRGTMTADIASTLSVHIPALAANQVETHGYIQSAAIVGLGWLYCQTGHRRTIEVLINEFTQPSPTLGPTKLDIGCYALSVGFGLGLLLLGKGDNSAGLADLNLSERLLLFVEGGRKSQRHARTMAGESHTRSRVLESDDVNISKLAPGALMALGLVHLRTNNEVVAQRLALPNTKYLLEATNTQIIMLKVVARYLILWEKIQPTREWVTSLVPTIAQGFGIDEPGQQVSSVDSTSFRHIHAAVVAAACCLIGLRFAGTFNEDARATLIHYAKAHTDTPHAQAVQDIGRSNIMTYSSPIFVAIGMVMAGTGDLRCLRLLRRLHAVHSPEVTYGTHMAIASGIGLLALGGGSLTLAQDTVSVAALAMSFFPVYPLNSHDNRIHIQAFRHIYQIAVVRRSIVTHDVVTKQTVHVPLLARYRDGDEERTLNVTSPFILPVPLDHLIELSVVSDRYDAAPLLPSTVDWHLESLKSSFTYFVRSRPDSVPYSHHRKMLESMIAQANLPFGAVGLPTTINDPPVSEDHEAAILHNSSTKNKDKRSLLSLMTRREEERLIDQDLVHHLMKAVNQLEEATNKEKLDNQILVLTIAHAVTTARRILAVSKSLDDGDVLPAELAAYWEVRLDAAQRAFFRALAAHEAGKSVRLALTSQASFGVTTRAILGMLDLVSTDLDVLRQTLENASVEKPVSIATPLVTDLLSRFPTLSLTAAVCVIELV